MNILYYFKEKDVLMDKWQRAHIFDELERNGHSITVFNPLQYGSMDEANSILIKYIIKNKEKFDLFMTPHGSKDLFLITLEKIKSEGLATLLICFDNLIVPFAHRDIADKYDMVWLTSKETKYLFDKWGAKTIFLPYAANPYLLRPNNDKEILKIAFIGTPYGSRVNMINHIINNNIDLSIFFNSSKRSDSGENKILTNVKMNDAANLMKFPIGRKVIIGAIKQKFEGSPNLNITSENLEIKDPINLDQLGNLYSKYALSLSSTAARNTGVLKKPVNIVNLRSFEIPMSGGIQICAYFDELAEYFEEDKEILFYRNNDELIEKAEFYLRPENEKLRSEIKIAARKRSVDDHTWSLRFDKVFNVMGLRNK